MNSSIEDNQTRRYFREDIFVLPLIFLIKLLNAVPSGKIIGEKMNFNFKNISEKFFWLEINQIHSIQFNWD